MDPQPIRATGPEIADAAARPAEIAGRLVAPEANLVVPSRVLAERRRRKAADEARRSELEALGLVEEDRTYIPNGLRHLGSDKAVIAYYGGGELTGPLVRGVDFVFTGANRAERRKVARLARRIRKAADRRERRREARRG